MIIVKSFKCMKNIVLNLLFVFSATLFFVSCDEAEVEDRRYGHFSNIFDVEDAGNKNYVYFAPAYSDTVYAVSRGVVEASGVTFNAGDRVYMKMGYEYDAYSTALPKMNIAEVITKVTPREMKRKNDVQNLDLYNSVFASAHLISFNDMKGETRRVDFIWADDKTQNICVRYNEEQNCEPIMVLDSLRNKTLYFRLYANLEEKGWNENEAFVAPYDEGKQCRILSFKMDWDMIKDELTVPEQTELEQCDTLTSHIVFVRSTCKKDNSGKYIPEGGFTFDKFANPLYKSNP